MTSAFIPMVGRQANFAFPLPLSERYRPKRIAEFAGLKRVKRVMTRFAAAPTCSAFLFSGPSGTGKTSMALALAAEMGAEIHHIAARACDLEMVERTVAQCWYMPLLGGWHVVVVDEADQMTAPAQVAWLSKLDATAFPPATVFIFTCNGTDRLEPRFLSRTMRLEFEGELNGEAMFFLTGVWLAEAPGTQVPDLSAMLAENKGNIRDVLMRLQIEILAA